MREDPKKRNFRKTFCWVIAPLMWGAPALLAWLDWRADLISDERFATRVGVGLLVLPLIIAIPFIEAWRARQPKPPPVYRSTILD